LFFGPICLEETFAEHKDERMRHNGADVKHGSFSNVAAVDRVMQSTSGLHKVLFRQLPKIVRPSLIEYISSSNVKGQTSQLLTTLTMVMIAY